jgi:hypothetical protein
MRRKQIAPVADAATFSVYYIFSVDCPIPCDKQAKTAILRGMKM